MRFLSVLCLLCGLVVPATALDRDAFTFTKYDLTIRIEPEQQRLAAEGRITLRNDSAAFQKSLSLQISSSLGWRAIQIAGKPVQFLSQTYTSDIDHTGVLSEAIVTLPQEVPVKGILELDVRYEGTITLDATRLTRIGVPEETAKHSDWDQIGSSFTAVRGAGYVAWYPVAMEAASLSESSELFERLSLWKRRQAGTQMAIRLTVLTSGGSESPEVIASKPDCQSPTDASSADCRFNQLAMVAPTIIAGHYVSLNSPSVDVHYVPEHKNAADTYVAASEKLLPLITEWFGPSKQSASLIELADLKAAPFESGAMLLTPLGNLDSQVAEITAAHQLTHAAFLSQRSWIYEGLAHFAQALYTEKQHGREAALRFLGEHRPAVVDAEKAISQKRNATSNADESLLNTSLAEFDRTKAAYVWWMLRDMIGESPLKKALNSYHADQDKEAASMPHLVGAQAQRDLEWFFDDWVYRDRGLPDFRVQSVYPRQTLPDGYLVTVSIENLGSAGAEVPVILKTQEGDLTKRLQVLGKTTTSVRFQVLRMPTEVVVNDGSVPESDMSNNALAVRAPAK